MATTIERTRNAQQEDSTHVPRPFVVTRRRRETHDTFTVELVPSDGCGKFAFTPGQFNMLYVHGIGEVPISISGDPERPSVLVHTIRRVGAVTRALERLRPGDALGVRGPFGTGWPVADQTGRDIVIVAGGIGLAPLRPVMYHVLAHRDDFGRVILLYGSRTPSDMVFVDELSEWRSRFDLEVEVTVDRASSAWHGGVGVVTGLIDAAPFDGDETTAFVCGPEVMMRFSVEELLENGVAPGDIFVSLERNMNCGVGLCGHCQLGGRYICKCGPVYRYDEIQGALTRREL